MIEVLAFFMWFMPCKLRLAIARKVGEPFRHHDQSNVIVWVVGRKTAFLEHAKFTVSRPAPSLPDDRTGIDENLVVR